MYVYAIVYISIILFFTSPIGLVLRTYGICLCLFMLQCVCHNFLFILYSEHAVSYDMFMSDINTVT
jgi:hypothetical protein